ncbi:hypothetical protein [Novosphingobium sp. 9U]|uniref:hypothetical protein n=1 Tax=Novosphingobium sp. 9U TaxID=2653158 RepID=UPI0012F2B883|nr:hypothetical protein [Novosphingobium sp. 9U]VWX51181.1 membrane hypothetical protein [Novosphingobium sp. 9U]
MNASEGIEADKLKLQFITDLYKEQCTHGRHTEAQRQFMAGTLLILSGILLSMIAALHFDITAMPIALTLVALALCAKKCIAVFEMKREELTARRDHYRFEAEKITGTEVFAPAANGRNMQRLSNQWNKLFNFVLVLGILLTLIIAAQA